MSVLLELNAVNHWLLTELDLIGCTNGEGLPSKHSVFGCECGR